MADQNSVAEHEVKPEIRPDALMDELGVKKETYYTYLKQLGIKAQKDSKGRAYLNGEQANLVRLLREHVKNGGKIDAFAVSNEAGSIVQAQAGDLDSMAEGINAEGINTEAEHPEAKFDVEALMAEAAELRGQQLVMGDLVKLKLASQLTYDDLPETVRAKVDAVREAASPKHQPDQIAADLLQQWRQRRQPQPEAATVA